MLGDRWGDDPSLTDTYVQTFDATAPGIVDYARAIATAGESLVSAVARARLQLDMTDAQRQLLDVQIDRAQRGLPPIQTTAYTGGGGVSAQGITITPGLLLVAGLAAVVLLRK